MNDQNTNTNSSPGVEPTTPPVSANPEPIVKPNLREQISSKIPPKVKETFNKFYANKKVFWPVTIVSGLLFLTILLGLLFGSGDKGQSIAKKISTPTPVSQENVDQKSQGSTETKLEQLKDQINAFDVNQQRLQPPAIDFEVSF